MVNLKNRGLTPIWCVFLAASFVFSGCDNEIRVDESTKKRLIISGDRAESSNSHSRSYWEEDSSVSGGLAFHWENSVEGQEDMIVAIAEGNYMLEFVESPNYYSRAIVKTTSNPLVSQITLRSELKLGEDVGYENEIKAGQEIYSYLPVEKGDVLEGMYEVVSTMIIPREINVTELNSTKHLSRYAYMAGKGVINEKAEFFTSNIHYRLLPAIIRFKITNTDETDAFVPEIVKVTGDVSTIATIKTHVTGQSSGERATENVIYSTGNKFGLRLSGVSIPQGETANTYALVFPTDLKQKKLLIELEGIYNGNKMECLEYIPGDDIPGDGFKSNFCYTFNMRMSKSAFEVESVTCEAWTGDIENVVTNPVE